MSAQRGCWLQDAGDTLQLTVNAKMALDDDYKRISAFYVLRTVCKTAMN